MCYDSTAMMQAAKSFSEMTKQEKQCDAINRMEQVSQRLYDVAESTFGLDDSQVQDIVFNVNRVKIGLPYEDRHSIDNVDVCEPAMEMAKLAHILTFHRASLEHRETVVKMYADKGFNECYSHFLEEVKEAEVELNEGNFVNAVIEMGDVMLLLNALLD